MSCVFKHKESKINTLSELKEQDILDGPYIKSGKDEQFNQYHNDLIESVQENYNLGIDKFFNVLEQKTTGLFGVVKKFVQPIDNSFKQLDQARKDLGIYDSKESYLSFKEAAEAKSIKSDEISNIKPGVAELFESNGDFASQIYQALGFEFDKSKREYLKNIEGDLKGIASILYSFKNKIVNNDVKDYTSHNIFNAGLYDVIGDEIGFNNLHKNLSKEKKDSILLHEIIHSYTGFVFIKQKFNLELNNNEQEFLSNVNKLYKEAKEFYSTQKPFDNFYGLTNEEEFVAEALSNPIFQNYLKQIKSKENISLFDKLIALFKKFLSIESNSNLDNVIKATLNYISLLDNTNQKIRQNQLNVIKEGAKKVFEEEFRKVREDYRRLSPIGRLADMYANRYNKNAFIVENDIQITPQQKQQATFMFSEFLDVYLQDFEQVEKILKEEKIIDKKCS